MRSCHKCTVVERDVCRVRECKFVEKKAIVLVSEMCVRASAHTRAYIVREQMAAEEAPKFNPIRWIRIPPSA